MSKSRNIWYRVHDALAVNDNETARELIKSLWVKGISLTGIGSIILGSTYLRVYYGVPDDYMYDSLMLPILAPISCGMIALGIEDMIEAKDLNDYARLKTR